MTSQDVVREPAGAPESAGGQFAPKYIRQPEGPLTESATGSFLYPPLVYGNGTVQEYLDFWHTVPIADRVLANLQTAYKSNRERWIGENLDAWAKVADNEPEWVKWCRTATPEQYRTEWAKKRAVELERLSAERPKTEINNIRARSIAVAMQMYRCSGVLPKEDQALVDSHEITISRSQPVTTVKQIWDDYHLAEIADHALTDQDLAVQQELAELRKHIGATKTL